MVLSKTPQNKSECTGRHSYLLATLPKLLIGNGYTAVGCINPDTEREREREREREPIINPVSTGWI
jgi:hypothetical protein